MGDNLHEKSNFPTSLQEWLVFLASLVVLAAAGLGIYQRTAKPAGNNLDRVQGVSGTRSPFLPRQSPVRIVGGSMKLRTTVALTINTPCGITGFAHASRSCAVSVPHTDISVVSLEGVVLANDSTIPAATSWLGLDATWAMTVFARKQGGVIDTTKGVDVCVTDGTTCGTGTLIAVSTFDAATALITEALSGEETIVRYNDTNYNGKSGNFLEHIGKISFKVNSAATANTYKCPAGNCQISIGL